MFRAAVVMSLLAMVASASGQAEIQLRVVGAAEFDLASGAQTAPPLVGSGSVDPGLVGPFSAEFYVQALIVNAPEATGFVTIGGELRDDITGIFEPAPLTNTEALNNQVPGLDFQSRTGLFPSYRATVGNDNSSPANGMFDTVIDAYTFLPLNIEEAGNGECLDGEWCNLYRFRWTTPDLTDRTIQIEATSEFGGYQTLNDGLEQPVPVSAEPFMLTLTSDRPGPFNIIEPLPGTYVTTTAPTIRWTASPNTDSYVLTIDNAADFSSPEFLRAGITETELTLPSEPRSLPTGVLFIRIEAVGTAGSVSITSDFAAVVAGTCPAEITGEDPPNVTILDLLQYLDDYFSATIDGTCGP